MDSIRDYIIFQDHYLVVCNKPAGLPVQEDLTKDPSLHRILQSYCKQNLYLCHRIDRPVSGLVILAKDKETAAKFQEQLIKRQINKEYLAIVQKKEIPNEGTLIDHLTKEGQKRKAFISDVEQGQKSVLQYHLLSELDKYLLLDIQIITGRFHQIRLQLSHAGLPIRGDIKYGARRGNKNRSIGLHSWKIAFSHPSTGQKLNFEAELPTDDIWPVVKKIINEL